jgi:hypothetical protein
MENLSHDSRSASLSLNSGPTEYKAGMLTTLPQGSAIMQGKPDILLLDEEESNEHKLPFVNAARVNVSHRHKVMKVKFPNVGSKWW